MKHQKIFAALLLNFAFLLTVQPAAATSFSINISQNVFADKFYRTELYFGLNIPGGSEVSEAEWSDFLEQEVTPRFPEGFTVIDGYGQYRDSAGKIVREESRVLVLFYPEKERAAVNSKIEEVRAAYKNKFKQEFVLRLDFRRSVAVSF